MASWWSGLIGGRAKLPPMSLDGYPPYDAPHPGRALMLTPEQARENFDHFLAERQERLNALGSLLASFGLDLGKGLEASDPEPFLKSLQDWTVATWPGLYDPSLAKLEVWWNTRRRGREIVYSMLLDVGIALGEMVVRRRPDYAWTLDLDPDNKRDEMDSYQRPVVRLTDDPAIPSPIDFDFEDIARGHYSWGERIHLDSLIGRGVLEALSGAHEAFWLKEDP